MAQAERDAGEKRTLHFTLEIETELGGGDEPLPTIEYVTEWLNQNNYGYRLVGQWIS